jgi:iron transport multicopper oxidase
MACDPSFEFSIDGHNMTIIEADGENTEPFTVNSIPIFAAQRYSFVLNANQPVGNYWIRAKPSVALSTSFDKGLNSAILRYEGAREVEPKTKNQTSVRTLDETDLHPLENPRAPGKPYPGGADVVLPLNLSINAAGDRFLVNGTTFRPPTVPVLLQILSGNRPAQELLPKGSVFPLPRNKVIEVVLMGNNAPGGPVRDSYTPGEKTILTCPQHPFHLHGVSFIA